MKTALFPGTFDPPSSGHLDIIQRASRMCDKLHVGIATNMSKSSLFTAEERKELLKTITKDIPHIEIFAFDGLVVDYAKKKKAEVIVRGVRAFSDFEYEFRMALANRKMSGIETLFLMADERHFHIHSTMIREIGALGGPLKDFVPKSIESKVRKRIQEKF